MELRQLKYFCAVCKTGSLSAAANELYVSEQTLSASLLKLEGELGVRLLEKGRWGARPTAAGATLFHQGAPLLEQIDQMIDNVTSGSNEGVVHFVYVSESLMNSGAMLSFDAIAAFQKDYPKVKVEVIEGTNESCVNSVRENTASIALVVGNQKENGLIGELVCYGPQVLAMREDDPLSSKQSVSIGDLRDRDILIPPESGFSKDLIVAQCAKHGFEPNFIPAPRRFYFDFAAEGRGLAFAPKNHPALSQYDGLTSRTLLEDKQLRIPLYLCIRNSKDVRPEVLLFKDYLLKKWQSS